MVKNKCSVFKVFIGMALLFAGFVGVLSFSGGLTKILWAGLLLFGSLIFLYGWDELLVSENLGKPIPFNMLEQNQVYLVIAKLPEIQAILIGESEELERGETGSAFEEKLRVRVVGIPDSLAEKLEKGRKFIKVANTIFTVPS